VVLHHAVLPGRIVTRFGCGEWAIDHPSDRKRTRVIIARFAEDLDLDEFGGLPEV